MNVHDIEPLQDAANLLRSYLKLCKSLPRGDSYYLGRIERAIAAIEADRQRRVYGRWQTVPTHPTLDQIHAGEAARKKSFLDGEALPCFSIWDAMIKAAPQPADQDEERLAMEANRQLRGEPVAYLDLGVGGYMDVGTDLTDEQLAALPKGRHMLGIIGTYGVDGCTPAEPGTHQGYQPIQSGSLPPPPAPKATQPAEPVKLECPKCDADRSKVPCAGELMNCHFKGEAQSAEPVKVPVIEPSDLRIDTYRPEPYSAWVVSPEIGVRVTHVPTGLSAACHKDRSVHRNRALAMEKLQKMLQAHGPVKPRTEFDDPRVQQVYKIICGDNHPRADDHLDDYVSRLIVSRLIVDALFPDEPAKVDAKTSVLSEEEILEVWYASAAGPREYEVIEFARALLARYGRQPAEPVNLCDCERSHNGLGIGSRECDCPAGRSPQPTEPSDEMEAMEAVMESVDPATWPGLTAAQRCALGRFAKPQPTESVNHSIQDCPEVDKWNCKYCERVNSCPVQGHRDAQPAEPVKHALYKTSDPDIPTVSS